MAFLDIETCGLGDSVVFLVGILLIDMQHEKDLDVSPLRFESLLAEDPSMEPQVLRTTADILTQVDFLFSFNGKSFDVPRLKKRAFRHGIEWPGCQVHVDLLHEVRRLWKDHLPDCRLSTVERRLLGLERGGHWDIPGSEVPNRYWDFVMTGENHLIEPVKEHNRRDVLAMLPLLNRMVSEGMRI